MALWTPADLAVPPRVWWNGDAAVFSGSNLSSWANSGSEGGSATIGGTPTQATLNSLNGVAFDAAGEKVSLTVGSWGSSGVMQFFEVSDPISFPSGVEGAMHRGTPATNSGLTLNINDVEIYSASQGFAQGPVIHSAGLPNADPYFLFGSNGTTQAIYLNGTAATLTGDTVSGTFPNLGSASWDFGEGWDPANQNGANFQRLLFDYALSTVDRQKLEGWAAWKYGLAALLPGDHPYKSAAPTTGYALVGSLGALALTGSAANLRRGRRAAATSGVFTVSGRPSSPRAVRRMPTGQGAVSALGQAAALSRGGGRTLGAGHGSLELTGTAAGLVRLQRRSLSAEPASWALDTGLVALKAPFRWAPATEAGLGWSAVTGSQPPWTLLGATLSNWDRV
jgi:hypothetical protein